MVMPHPPWACQTCGEALGKNFKLSTVRLVDESGGTVHAHAVGFTHLGECADQFRKKLRDEHPDWRFEDEDEERSV
jgi:hypothetical protein